MTDRLWRERRVVVFAPTGRDGVLTCHALAEAHIDCIVSADIHAFCAAALDGAGVLLIAEEAILDEAAFTELAEALHRQPPWSDLPVLILTTRGADSPTATRALEDLGNVTLLERPLRVGSLVSSVRAGVRARQRQYQIRAHMAEREQAEESLREADRRKDEFLATLAHELRNPLAPISNAAHILHLKPKPESVQWASDVIGRQVGQLARLVEDLLDVSRISRDKIELRRSRVDLRDIVAAAIETSQPLLAERGHEFIATLPAEPLPVNADVTRIAQVVSNLLNNAAKFTPRGGRILLVAERDAGSVAIRVSDNGVGIDAAMLPKIFEMFIQEDNRLERTTSGLGIGLTLVRHFVQMHGGTVRAASAGRGRGTEFVIRLPLDDEASTDELPSQIAATRDHPGLGLRILVVDDNRDIADTMSNLLKMLGNDVATANEATQALESIARSPPDVALLDIGMPNMNGYDVAEHIRAQPYGKDILLIALTGWGQESDRERSRESGFDFHLVKPVDMEHLQRLLSERKTRTAAQESRTRKLH